MQHLPNHPIDTPSFQDEDDDVTPGIKFVCATFVTEAKLWVNGTTGAGPSFSAATSESGNLLKWHNRFYISQTLKHHRFFQSNKLLLFQSLDPQVARHWRRPNFLVLALLYARLQAVGQPPLRQAAIDTASLDDKNHIAGPPAVLDLSRSRGILVVERECESKLHSLN